MPPSIDKDLQRLEVELKQLEAEYNMFFSGRLPKPPWETRARVEAMVTQYDRACQAVGEGLTSPAEVRRVLGFAG